MSDTSEYVVPVGWARVKIGDLAELKYGKGLPQKRREPGEVPVYGSNGIVGTHTKCVTDGPAIVIGRKGTVGAVHFCNGPCWPIDTTYFVDEFRATKPLFLTRLLQSLHLSDLDTSTAIPGLNRNDAYAQEAYLPPLAEQERIVAKVEALLLRVRSVQQRLAAVPGVLKRFRQAILAHACSGKLTEDWRERDPDDTGKALLALIRRERKSAEASSERRRRSKAQFDPSGDSASIEWEVPPTWEWPRINDLLHYERTAAYGVLQPGSNVPSGVPFVRVCDLARGTVVVDSLKRIDPAIDRRYPRTRLEGGEVLVSLVGTIGRVAVAPESVAGANVARAIGMLPLCPHVDSHFLRYSLEQTDKNGQLVDLAREVARKTLNLGLLKAVRVPLLPLDEQHEIVRRAEMLFSLADSIEQHLQTATKRAEALTSSVLAMAFRGELVPTEADLARVEGREYESADQLLLRIREQLAQRAPEKKPRHKRAFRDPATIEDKVTITVKRNLLGVLKEAKAGLSPEELFRQAGCTEDDIDGFYGQLRVGIEAGQIVQMPEKPDPDNPTVVLSASKV